MLRQVVSRLGLILAIMLVIGGVTVVYEKAFPAQQAAPPKAPPRLDASLYDPDMLLQYELLKSSGRLTAGQSGQATGYYRSADGPVALSMTDIELLNQDYRADKRALEEGLARSALTEDYEAEALEESGWGADTSY